MCVSRRDREYAAGAQPRPSIRFDDSTAATRPEQANDAVFWLGVLVAPPQTPSRRCSECTVDYQLVALETRPTPTATGVAIVASFPGPFDMRGATALT